VGALKKTTSNGPDAYSGNTLQFFHHFHVQFGLTPRQYLTLVAKFIRRGKFMMRKCLLCKRFFESQVGCRSAFHFLEYLVDCAASPLSSHAGENQGIPITLP
jgi:hypothetical protein